jgi:hypothetical protein
MFRKSKRSIGAARSLLALIALSTIVLLTTGLAGATPITNIGTAILQAGNGSVIVSGNGTTGGCIIWFNGVEPADTCPTSGSGNFTVQGGSTDPYLVGETGTIQNLNFNTPLPLVGFMQLTGHTTKWDLADIRFNGSTAIGDCTSTPDSAGNTDTSPGVSCTPANSPFTLTNGLADSSGKVDTVAVTFTVDAYGYYGAGSGTNYDEANRFVGVFSTQDAVAGADTTDNIASILAEIEGGGSVSASWSATFTPVTTAPESATFLLFGVGLMVMGSLKKHTRKP